LWRFITDFRGNQTFSLGACFLGSEVKEGLEEWVTVDTVWKRNSGHIVVARHYSFRRPTKQERELIEPLVARMIRVDKRDYIIKRRRRGYKTNLSDT
jgi:hypothetical protein